MRRAPRLRKLQQTKQVDEIVGEAVEQQTEGVGQKTVAAEPVGAEAILELLDAVLALAAIVVKGKDLRRPAGTVGDDEAQVDSGGRVLGLVADAALTWPTAGTMAKTGEAALRNSGAAIEARQTFLPRCGLPLKDHVGSNAQCILDAEKLAELVEQWQSETSVAAQLDGHAGKGGFQSRHQPQQHRDNARMTGGIARSRS